RFSQRAAAAAEQLGAHRDAVRQYDQMVRLLTTAPSQAARSSSLRSLAANVFFYESSRAGASPATSSPRSALAPGAPPTRHSAPTRSHPVRPAAAPAGALPARG